GRPVRAFHNRAVPSLLAVARVVPLGLNATAVTGGGGPAGEVGRGPGRGVRKRAVGASVVEGRGGASGGDGNAGAGGGGGGGGGGGRSGRSTTARCGRSWWWPG